MKLRKLWVVFAALLAAAAFSVAIHAYPMPGPDEEVYVMYYWDAARTSVAGQRGIAHGEACYAWHSTWGTTTQYARVFVEKCPTGGIEF